jgi:NADH-quinone oxidoreductase subunit L
MQKMGGLRAKLPVTSTTFIISTLAIAGIPPLAGFFSKDEILWQTFSSPNGSHGLWAIGLAVAGLTACYMFRQVFLVFYGECRADHETQHHLHESPPVMTVPLQILAVGAAVAGLLWIPHVFLPFEHWLEPVMAHHGAVEAHAGAASVGTELGLMLVSVVVALLGISVAWLIYRRQAIAPERFSNALGGVPYRTLFNKYYVDEMYNLVFVRGVVVLCRVIAWFDLHVIDGIVNLSAAVVRGWAWVAGLFDLWVVDGAVNGVAVVTQFVGQRIRNLQTGAVNAYVYAIVLGVLGSVFLYWSLAAAR